MLAFLGNLPRHIKKLLLVCVDAALLVVSLWLCFVIRLEELWPRVLRLHWPVLMWGPPLALPVFYYLGLYHTVVRHMAPKFALTIVKAATTAALLLLVVRVMGEASGVPRSVYFLYWVITGVAIGGIRMVVREILPRESGIRKKRVLVYGAGASGTQIAKALQASGEYLPVGFLDDNKELQGLEILGLKVYPPRRLPALKGKLRIAEIILSIPSLPRTRRLEIIAWLKQQMVPVKTIPSIPHLLSGKVRVDELRAIDIEDLLFRDPVAPDPVLLKAHIRDRSVLVTGAGGSIGAELCRQILEQGPARLVLFDCSEFALYQIEKQLRKRHAEAILVPVLGSVLEQSLVTKVMRDFAVDTIYHAAAYKHVPMVEENAIVGAKNNIFGTLHLARAAIRARVRAFILISSDKAVRPTSVMGATKRFSELILQALTPEKGTTRFIMVRFGNVLDSSGSVVPLFREQIRSGGPVTVTDPEMTRFFMTLAEAAQLVIQAGALGKGGDLFVLDMGEPVKILDLAEKMILLSGLSVRRENERGGDIPIRFIGARPGEKLHEELLIGENVFPTEHPRIKRAQEQSLPWSRLKKDLDELADALATHDGQRLQAILRHAIRSYQPVTGLQPGEPMEIAAAPRKVEAEAGEIALAEKASP